MRRIAKPLALLTLVLLAAPPLHARPRTSWEAFLARALALLATPWNGDKDGTVPDGELRGGADPDGLRGGFDPNGQPSSDLRGGSDPNGEPSSELRSGLDPNGSS